MIFGYLNRNWNDEITVPIGPSNTIEPGGPDQGQPTYFFPRRSQFVFKVKVPKDFGTKDLIWSLTSNGKTEKAYGTLKPDYLVDSNVMMANFGAGGQTGNTPDIVGNKAPVLTLEGDRVRQAKVGEPVTLTAVAQDDGKPRVRPLQGGIGTGRLLPNSATGLRLVWFKYRGTGAVSFDPPQFSAWEDTRDGANSPWAAGWRTPAVPTDNKWVVRAKFSEPGQYVLRVQAHDGGLAVAENVTINVTR
jgi:hypothetical protein